MPNELWEDDDRQRPRGRYLIPCLLHDDKTNVAIKAVMLDLSANGCRVFTNDRRVRSMDEEVLLGRRFAIEFDFYDLDVADVHGTIANVHAGKHAATERQFGIEFEELDALLARDINRQVHRDIGS